MNSRPPLADAAGQIDSFSFRGRTGTVADKTAKLIAQKWAIIAVGERLTSVFPTKNNREKTGRKQGGTHRGAGNQVNDFPRLKSNGGMGKQGRCPTKQGGQRRAINREECSALSVER
jgi:hypothetical protein